MRNGGGDEIAKCYASGILITQLRAKSDISPDPPEPFNEVPIPDLRVVSCWVVLFILID